MKTKIALAAAIAFTLFLPMLVSTGCGDSHDSGSHAHQYTCTHHPEVVQDKPGDCPKCGMKLVEKH
jgi:membrane fusion protein, copper/silver efflux system